MDITLLVESGIQPQVNRSTPNIAEGSLSTLLHHLTKLPGNDELSLTGNNGAFGL